MRNDFKKVSFNTGSLRPNELIRKQTKNNILTQLKKLCGISKEKLSKERENYRRNKVNEGH